MLCASSSLERLERISSCISRLRSRNRTRSTSRRGFKPFCAKSLAPAANASLMAGRSLRPVSMRIGSSGPASARIWRQASMPERFGIITSSTTTSGFTSG